MEYNDYNGINQSALTAMTHGVHGYLKLKKEDEKDDPSRSLTIGNMVDILTEGNDPLDHYFIADVPEIPEAIKSIFDRFIAEYSDYSDLEPLLNIAKEHYINSRWKDETIWNKIEPHMSYLEFMVENKEKEKIIPTEWYETAKITYASMRDHSHTRYLTADIDNEPDWEIHYQYEIYFEYLGHACKAKLDKVCINHEAKIIIPIDFKTMAERTHSFFKSFFTFRYDIQASFYTEALRLQYPDYNIANFSFIVESTTTPGCPLIYECAPSVINKAKSGYTDKYGKTYMGWLEAFERILWHESKELWDYSKEIYDSSGKIVVSL